MSMESLKTIVSNDITNRGSRPGSFAEQATKTAIRACLKKLEADGIEASNADLIPLIQIKVSEALPQALDDLREAHACGMDQIAVMTFLASMCLAGVAAAIQYEEEARQ
jgi:hypothetical protein